MTHDFGQKMYFVFKQSKRIPSLQMHLQMGQFYLITERNEVHVN